MIKELGINDDTFMFIRLVLANIAEEMKVKQMKLIDNCLAQL